MLLPLLFSSCQAVAAARAAGSTPPHLIFCLVDDLGYYNVGFHNPDQVSPEIDALAAEGVVLEAFYTFKYCSPTRSSFLSGRLPIHVNQLLPGAINNPGGIDLRMTLLPQKLKLAGYKTAQTGKWHCGARSELHLPVNRGFDSHFGFLGGGEDHYQNKGKQPVDLWRDHAPAYGENGTYSCELYSAEALRVVTQHDPKDPLFLYVAYQNTHTPYECPVQYQDPAQNFSTRRIVQGMLTCVSISVGNLTRTLKSKGMWDNTLLVFSGDNGGPQYWGSNNHPLRYGFCCLCLLPHASNLNARAVVSLLPAVVANGQISKEASEIPHSQQAGGSLPTCEAAPSTARCISPICTRRSVLSRAVPTALMMRTAYRP